MVNPFTLEAKIRRIQQEVLTPLYSMYPGQEQAEHAWLLVETGRIIASHQSFIEELCESRLIAAIFKIVKFLGGADQLTEDDFSSFTAYVKDGGIRAMVKMLLAPDKEKVFISEFNCLPERVRANAPQMLAKSNRLHKDFITGYFKEQHGSWSSTPDKLKNNFSKSETFITRLASLAEESLKKSRPPSSTRK